MIDLTINGEKLKRTIQLARERNVIIPTFRQQRHPNLIPENQRSFKDHRTLGNPSSQSLSNYVEE